ncbi:ComF family protein [Mesobacillus maritimus]|uniref:ComF family protein n=1 Tax=Mesobacillus maritimus TaxID=1643336 RepID=UPI00384D8B37
MKLFLDEYCLVCNGILTPVISWTNVFLDTEEQWTCEDCQSKLKLLVGERCSICSRVLAADYRNENLCYDCVRWEQDSDWSGALSQNISLYEYNDFLKEVIAKFKYRGDYILARAFRSRIKKELTSMNFDALTPIPLSQERLYERGFNQAEALIIEAGFKPSHLLTRIHTEKQSKKSRSDRIHLSQVFQLDSEIQISLEGKNILLVDDIYTTGSTLRHAAKVLLGHGARSVSSLTLAR